MSYVAGIGDPHCGNFSRHGGPKRLGINTRGWTTVECLRRAVTVAEERNASCAVILGDLIDSMKPPPQLLAAVRDALESSGITKYVLKGNHDSASTEPGDHAIGALHSDTVFIIEEPTCIKQADATLLLVPFIAGHVKDWLPGVLDDMPPDGTDRILCLHAGIQDDKTAEFLHGAQDSIELDTLVDICARYDIGTVLAGNWHDHRVWKRRGVTVVQAGALTPTGYANLGVEEYGKVCFVQDRRLRTVTVPGPRFLKMKWPCEAPEADGNDYYIEIEAKPDDMSEAVAYLESLRADELIADGSVKLDDTALVRSAARAATAAGSVDGIREAVHEYVHALKVGVDKASVCSRLNRYLGV